MNVKAFNRLAYEYNIAFTPTCFFDGGYELFAGGPTDETPFRDRIELCGQRAVPALDLIAAIDWLGNANISITVRIGNDTPANEPPDIPVISTGIAQGDPDVSYNFETNSSDPESDELYYQWDWGDGTTSNWIGPIASGGQCNASHTWTERNTYEIKTRAKDSWGAATVWSAPWTIVIGCCIGVRGNIDGDILDQIDIADLVYFVDFSFSNPPGPEPPCLAEADVDGTGILDIADIVYMVDYMFSQPPGPAPVNCPVK